MSQIYIQTPSSLLFIFYIDEVYILSADTRPAQSTFCLCETSLINQQKTKTNVVRKPLSIHIKMPTELEEVSFYITNLSDKMSH